MKKLCIILLISNTIFAGDWSTYNNDNRRSGVTSDKLSKSLKKLWRYDSATPPQTAWTGPAKWDAYASNDGLQSLRNFDPVFYVTTYRSYAYFGSSSDNAVHCFDSKTGKEKWTFFTNGAVRVPPTIFDGKAYFGSDDGYAYCVDAVSGKEIWKFRPVESKLVMSNGRMSSNRISYVIGWWS